MVKRYIRPGGESTYVFSFKSSVVVENQEYCPTSTTTSLPPLTRAEEQYDWSLGSDPFLIEAYRPPPRRLQSSLSLARGGGDALQDHQEHSRDHIDSCRTLFDMGLLHLEAGSDALALHTRYGPNCPPTPI